jgi:hypothetical protein
MGDVVRGISDFIGVFGANIFVRDDCITAAAKPSSRYE